MTRNPTKQEADQTTVQMEAKPSGETLTSLGAEFVAASESAALDAMLTLTLARVALIQGWNDQPRLKAGEADAFVKAEVIRVTKSDKTFARYMTSILRATKRMANKNDAGCMLTTFVKAREATSAKDALFVLKTAMRSEHSVTTAGGFVAFAAGKAAASAGPKSIAQIMEAILFGTERSEAKLGELSDDDLTRFVEAMRQEQTRREGERMKAGAAQDVKHADVA